MLTAATTWMNLEDIIAKWIKPTQEDKHHMIPLIIRGTWRSQIHGDVTESKLILLAML